jgi:formate dehydrogenase major subunit
LLYHLLPGYLPAPTDQDTSLEVYRTRNTPQYADPRSPNWWQNRPKYMTSLLKAWWGDNATAANGFAYDYLPKRDRNYSHMAIFERMLDGEVKGALLWGQNPAVGGPNSNSERAALAKLQWLVAVDLWETETSIFWKRPGVDPADIKTEVFFFPAAASVEKEGSVTNSGRWAQWRYKAQEPIGQARPDLDIMDDLMKALKVEYAKGGVFPEPIVQLTWDYHEEGRHGASPHKVAREVNGYFTADVEFPAQNKSFKKGDQVPSFAFLRDDGTTACTCWVMAGSYVSADPKTGNMMARRDKTDAANGLSLYPKWAWAWPVNRRILYNRASCDAEGKPYAPQKWVVRWNAEKKAWEGDVPDGPWPPMAAGAEGRYSFIMNPEGHAYLFSPVPADGPVPEHYEPYESPVRNLLNAQSFNPAVELGLWRDRERETGTPDRFPIVATTYRLSEHWQAGAMTRNLPWLVELQPDMFVELSEELAREKGIKVGDRVTVSSARGKLTAYALVTKRFKPMTVDGKLVHQIGMPWHWGYAGIATGDSANLLTPHVGDANTTIPEYKAFLCDLRKA